MTIDPKIIKKMREMKAEGFLDPQIAQELGVAVNTVIKYTRDNVHEEKFTNNGKEVNSIDKINQLEKDWKITQKKPLLEKQMFDIIEFLDGIEEINSEDKSLFYSKLVYLLNKLENIDDTLTLQWIETKLNETRNQILVSLEQKINRVRAEKRKRDVELQKQQEQMKQRLRKSLELTLTETDELLKKPFSNEEKQDIIKSVMPYYAQPRFEIADILRVSLRNHILDLEQRKMIIRLWRQNYV
jgi:transcriptional regulator with XRE-family HTH domain